MAFGDKPVVVPETGETPRQRGQRLRAKPPNTSGLLRGNAEKEAAEARRDGTREKRAAEWTTQIATRKAALLSCLPKAQSSNAFIQEAIESFVWTGMLVQEYMTKRARGESVDDKETDAALKMLNQRMTSIDLVVNKWREDEEAAHQRVPQSVAEWIAAMDERPVEVVAG